MEDFMKRLLVAIAALGAVSGSALAADMAARPAYKAPLPPAPVYSWSGCYIQGGGGAGYWNQDAISETSPGNLPETVSRDYGGRGWIGQVGAGCDYQVTQSILIGVLGDYDFMHIHGQFEDPFFGVTGDEKQSSAWAVGGRIGYIVSPNLMTYINGGWTESHFNQVNFGTTFGNLPTPLTMASTNYQGWFVGGGTETSLAGFIPGLPNGLFLRSEYRYSYYGSKDNPILIAGLPSGFANHVHVTEQELTTSVVWKFNWMGH
jgi:outer membrane immunogenic protein